MGSDGAVFFETFSTETGDVPKSQWDALRFGMLCTDAQNFADTKAVIEKLCNQTDNCTYEQKKAAEFFFRSVTNYQKSLKQHP